MARILETLESAIYNTGIHALASGAGIYASRNHKMALMVEGHRHVWQTLADKVNPADNNIWFHVASLGEFEQGRPLIEEIRRRQPGSKIVLTFFSPSGYEVRKNYDGADAVCYLPFDTPRNVKRFLDAVNPRQAIFVKYEFWRNYLTELHRRGVPTYLVCAHFRPNQLFFKPWGRWYRNWLRLFTHIFVQEEADKSLLAGVGIDCVTVAGDTRFDRVSHIRSLARDIPRISEFTAEAPFTLMVGSSWPADEDIYIPWVNAHPQVKVVVAPHEFDAERLRALAKRFSGGAVLLSELENGKRGDNAQVLIIDCFGLLSSAYAYADAAYVGGGFGAGIHNINEAAVYGIPVLFGPRHDKFVEASQLIEAGGGFCISDAATFANIMNRFLADRSYLSDCGRAAGDYIASHTGATERILSCLNA